MIPLTAWPPSRGIPSTRTTERPRRADSIAAETPEIPAPTTQTSASMRRAPGSGGRRTVRVAVSFWSRVSICASCGRGDGGQLSGQLVDVADLVKLEDQAE